MPDKYDWLKEATDEQLEEADKIVRGDMDEELKNGDTE